MQLNQKFWRFAVLSVLSLALSACGGGGGGDSPSGGGVTPVPGTSPGAFTVSIDRSELRFSGEEGGSMPAQAVLGSGAGTLPAAIYLGSLDLGTAIQQVTVESVGMQVKFTVFPKSNLPAGEYSGNLQLFACPDEKCATHFAGSPVNVPYKVSIARGFMLGTHSVNLAAVSGATASAKVAVQLKSGVTSFTPTATSNANWLSITGQTADSFTIAAKAMPPGNYLGHVDVTSGGSTRVVSVQYTVSGDAGTVTRIIPDVASLAFSAAATASAPARTVNVVLPSWTNALSADIRYLGGPTGWLGAVKAGERSYTVSASAAALQAGTYQAELILRSENVAEVTIPVSFAVGAASWSISGATRFDVKGDTAAAALAGDLAIAMPELPPQVYSASSSAAWLKLSRSSGTTGGAPLRLTVDQAELLKLPNFRSHTADIAISAADSRIAPTKVTVTLAKALPELHFVTPYTRLATESGEVVLRGRGLDGVADIGRALQVSGATPSSLTRVSDSEVRVRLGASSGDVAFALPNALGAPTGAPVLRVVAPATYAAAALATAGSKGGLVYDVERRALYSVNKELQSVMRYAWNGGGWTATSVSLPSAHEVALSPDGRSLIVTATTGHIVLLDPATLDKQGSYATGWVGGDALNSLQKLAVTNDGRAYFQGGGTGGLAYFDLATREFGSIDDYRFEFGFGPWFSVSGDGSRLNIVQDARSNPSPKMLYLDASDRTPKANPAGVEFWYEAATSLHGDRFVEGTYKVWDRDWALIGNLALPDDSYFGRTPLASPDGKRVYVMAYPYSYSSPGSSATPRVFVFDSSTRMVSSTNLPLLGTFDLAGYPTCRDNAYGCNTRALGTISPDGKTLFFLGDASLVVAPVPDTLTPSVQRASMQRASGSIAVTPRMTKVTTGR
ncbi:MAG: hypothetical protein AB1437_13440 [Pseudomonadota bacterium]